MRRHRRGEWRPLFVRETAEQASWPLVARGTRDYLMRIAEDDGRLVKRCTDPVSDALRVLRPHAEEESGVRAAVQLLLDDGFLVWDGEGQPLRVDRLVVFGEATPSSPSVDSAEDLEAYLSAEDEPEPPNESKRERRQRLDRNRKRRVRKKAELDAESVRNVCGHDAEPSADNDAEMSAPSPPRTPLSLEKDTTKEKQGADACGTSLSGSAETGSGHMRTIPRGLGGDSRKRTDVRKLHEAWKTEFGYRKHQFSKGMYCAEADALAEAIDRLELPDCLRVVEYAKDDGMVSGKLDPNNQPHDSIAYLFAPKNSARILKQAEQSDKRLTAGALSGTYGPERRTEAQRGELDCAKLRRYLRSKRAITATDGTWQPSKAIGTGGGP